MPIKWKKNKKLRPSVILDKIDAIKIIQKDGRVSFEAFQKYEADAALFTMIDFGVSLSAATKKEILSRAISTVVSTEILTEKRVLEELNTELKKYNSKREREFLLLTSISLCTPPPFKVFNINNCKIRLLPGNFPGKYKERKLLYKDWRKKNEHIQIQNQSTPHDYCKVIIKTKAKSSHEAVDKCLDALNLLRSIMCLFLNPNYTIFSSGGEQKPINTILLGGMHSLHFSNGRLAEKYYWYEPNYWQVKAYNIPRDRLEAFISNTKWVLGKLVKSPYISKLNDSLLRYVRAFDESDKNTVILKGWGAIESLVVSGENNYNLISKRVSYLFSEREYHKQVIEHLREYRNTSVHAGEYLEDATEHCYQLQRYFFSLVIFHIKNSKVYCSLDEANSFLDLPSDLGLLERRRELIDRAISFVGPNA